MKLKLLQYLRREKRPFRVWRPDVTGRTHQLSFKVPRYSKIEPSRKHLHDHVTSNGVDGQKLITKWVNDPKGAPGCTIQRHQTHFAFIDCGFTGNCSADSIAILSAIAPVVACARLLLGT